jgi:hypothetical protein
MLTPIILSYSTISEICSNKSLNSLVKNWTTCYGIHFRKKKKKRVWDYIWWNSSNPWLTARMCTCKHLIYDMLIG